MSVFYRAEVKRVVKMITLKNIYEDFVLAKELQGVSDETVKRYHYSIERMLLELGIAEIKNITTGDIRRWLMSRDIKQVSIRIDIKNLRTFFNWVVAEEYRSSRTRCLASS